MAADHRGAKAVGSLVAGERGRAAWCAGASAGPTLRLQVGLPRRFVSTFEIPGPSVFKLSRERTSCCRKTLEEPPSRAGKLPPRTVVARSRGFNRDPNARVRRPDRGLRDVVSACPHVDVHGWRGRKRPSSEEVSQPVMLSYPRPDDHRGSLPFPRPRLQSPRVLPQHALRLHRKNPPQAWVSRYCWARGGGYGWRSAGDTPRKLGADVSP